MPGAGRSDQSKLEALQAELRELDDILQTAQSPSHSAGKRVVTSATITTHTTSGPAPPSSLTADEKRQTLDRFESLLSERRHDSTPSPATPSLAKKPDHTDPAALRSASYSVRSRSLGMRPAAAPLPPVHSQSPSTHMHSVSPTGIQHYLDQVRMSALSGLSHRPPSPVHASQPRGASPLAGIQSRGISPPAAISTRAHSPQGLPHRAPSPAALSNRAASPAGGSIRTASPLADGGFGDGGFDAQEKLSRLSARMNQRMDSVRQAAILLRHKLLAPPEEERCPVSYTLAVQNALDLLDEVVRGEEGLPGIDERIKHRLEELDQARARITESRRRLDLAASGSEERERRLIELLTKYEVAAAAAEGVRKQNTNKIMALTKQLCDKQAEVARADEVMKQKQEQLRASHEALAHTSSQLSAMTDTNKEVSRLQEEKQELATQLSRVTDDLSRKEREVEDLSHQLSGYEELKKQMAESEAQLRDLEMTSATAAAEVQKLSSALQMEAESRTSQEQELASLQSFKASAEVELQTKARRIAELEGAVERLAADNADAAHRSLAADAVRSTEAERANKLQQELAQSEARGEMLIRELSVAREEITSLSRQLSEMGTEAETLRLERAAAIAKQDAVTEEMERVKASLSDETAHSVTLQQELANATARVDDLFHELESLRSRGRENETAEMLRQEDLRQKESQAEQLLAQLRERAAATQTRERNVKARELEVEKKLATFADREAMLQTMEKDLLQRRQALGHNMVTATISESKITELSQLLELKEAEVRELEARNASLGDECRNLECAHEQDTEKLHSLGQMVEMVRGQLQENTVQFGMLTEELQATKDELERERAGRGEMESRLRSTLGQSAKLSIEAKSRDTEFARLHATIDARTAELRHKDDEIRALSAQLREMREKVSIDSQSKGVLSEQIQLQESRASQNERRAEEYLREARATSEKLKELQRELTARRMQAEDSTRHASNLWSAIARLGKKFDDHCQNLDDQPSKPIHLKLEDANSFLRYVRGWWSMYKDKEPKMFSPSAANASPSPDRSARRGPSSVSPAIPVPLPHVLPAPTSTASAAAAAAAVSASRLVSPGRAPCSLD